MKSKLALLIFIFVLPFSVLSMAQNQLSNAEIQDFYKTIKQTKEYKYLKAKIDSFNNNKNEVPQEIDIKLVKKESGCTQDSVFSGYLKRIIVGISLAPPLDTYIFSYNRRKKQIVSINEDHNMMQIMH